MREEREQSSVRTRNNQKANQRETERHIGEREEERERRKQYQAKKQSESKSERQRGTSERERERIKKKTPTPPFIYPESRIITGPKKSYLSSQREQKKQKSHTFPVIVHNNILPL